MQYRLIKDHWNTFILILIININLFIMTYVITLSVPKVYSTVL